MEKTNEFIFSIRQVVELTGVSEFTLRGWETRYDAFAPYRSKTGRRLYSKTDILKVRLLKELLVAGFRIGQVAHHDLKALQSLLDQSRRGSKAPAVETSESLGPEPPQVQRIILLAGRHEWGKIQLLLYEVKKSLGPRRFIFEFLLPLIHEMNGLVLRQQFTISQEHIMSAMIKESLYQIISAMKKKSRRQIRVVLATPEGDFHEIGLLIAAALMTCYGIQQLYLGPNVPKVDLCEASLHFKATHVLLVSTISTGAGAKEDLYKYIHFLDRNLEDRIKLMIAGKNAEAHSADLRRPHDLLHSFVDLESVLNNSVKESFP